MKKSKFMYGRPQPTLQKRNTEVLLDCAETSLCLKQGLSKLGGATYRRLCIDSNDHVIKNGTLTLTRRYSIWMSDKKMFAEIKTFFIRKGPEFECSRRKYAAEITKVMKHLEASSDDWDPDDNDNLKIHMLIDVSFKILLPKDIYKEHEEQTSV